MSDDSDSGSDYEGEPQQGSAAQGSDDESSEGEGGGGGGGDGNGRAQNGAGGAMKKGGQGRDLDDDDDDDDDSDDEPYSAGAGGGGADGNGAGPASSNGGRKMTDDPLGSSSDEEEGGGGGDDDDSPKKKRERGSSSASRGAMDSDDDDGDKEEGEVQGGGGAKEKKKQPTNSKKKKKLKKTKVTVDQETLDKMTQKAKKRLFDDMAEDDDDDGDDDEEDEDDLLEEYEKDGFVVSDEEGEAGKEGQLQRKKAKKRMRLKKARGATELDEEDLDLIRESVNDQAEKDMRDSERGRAVEARNQEELETMLFADDDNNARDQATKAAAREVQRRQRRDAMGDEYNSEDSDDFIEDDIGYMAAEGGRRGSKGRKGSAGGFAGFPGAMVPGGRGGAGGPTQEQWDEMAEIFGDGIMDALQDDMMEHGGDVDVDEDEDDYLPDSRARRMNAALKKEFETKKSLALSKLEPAVLRKYFITEADNRIKATDRPERLQARMRGRRSATDADRRAEAEWIYGQIRLENEDVMPSVAKETIAKVLRFMQVEQYEVPFIWTHRKDYFVPYLNKGHLWIIYNLDEKWEKLIRRKHLVEESCKSLWSKLQEKGMSDDEGEDDGDEEGGGRYASETEGQAEDRKKKESWQEEQRSGRKRRALDQVERLQKVLEAAKERLGRGAQAANFDSQNAYNTAREQWGVAVESYNKEKAALEEKVAKDASSDNLLDSDDEDDDSSAKAKLAKLGSPPEEPARPVEVTEEALQTDVKEAEDKLKQAEVYLGSVENEIELEEEELRNMSELRKERRKQRRAEALEEKQREREKEKALLTDEAELLPDELYRYDLNMTPDEHLLRDMQNYVAMVMVNLEDEGGHGGGGGGTATTGGLTRARQVSRKRASFGGGGGGGGGGRGGDVDRPAAMAGSGDTYKACRKEGLREFANMFTIGPAKLGQVIKSVGTHQEKVPTPSEDPLTVAAEFVAKSKGHVRLPKGRFDMTAIASATAAAAAADGIGGVGGSGSSFTSRLLGSFSTASGDAAQKKKKQQQKDADSMDVDEDDDGGGAGAKAAAAASKSAVLREESMLAAVRHMVAREIAAEPSVRKQFRKIYRRGATVSTTPTEKGLQEIDFFHPLYGVHFLSRKPAIDYIDYPDAGDKTQFLKIEKAQRDGFLTVQVLPPQKLKDGFGGFGSMGGYGYHGDGMGGGGGDGDDSLMYELDIDKFMQDLRPAFLGTGYEMGVSPAVYERWEEQRELILREAIVDHLLPSFEQEMVDEMRVKAKEEVVKQAADALQKRLEVGPWADVSQTKFDQLVHPQAGHVKVMAVAVSQNSREPSYAVALDVNGQVTDYLELPGVQTTQREKLKEFLIANKPVVTVVNTSAGMFSKRMADMLMTTRRSAPDLMSGLGGAVEQDVGLIVDAVTEFHRKRTENDSDDGDDDEDWACRCVLMRDDVANIFATSERGKTEFPDYHVNLRQAISLGRMAQEPLTEYAGLWTTMDSMGVFGGDMLYLPLHPLQSEVSRLALLRGYEQRMIDAINDVGVDLNDACEYTHMRGLLQFVGGLGPKKAAALRAGVVQVAGGITERQALLDNRLLGHLVFTNAASFLKIDSKGRFEERDVSINPFDSMRIHPECYVTHEWAPKICANALEVENDIDEYASVVKSVMDDSMGALRVMLKAKGAHGNSWDPLTGSELEDKLFDLDLQLYAEELDRQGQGKRLLQLEAIKQEIRFPYYDRRRAYTKPTEEERFEWLTGETAETLRVGQKVTVRITAHNSAGVKGMLEGSQGVYAFIRPDKAMDEPQDMMVDYGGGGVIMPAAPRSIEAVLPRGKVCEGVILEVRKDRFEVSLSLKPGDLALDTSRWGVEPPMGWPRPKTMEPLDPYFDDRKAKEEYRKAMEARTKAIERAAAYAAAGVPISKGLGVASGKRFVSRSLLHPNFKNVLFKEAETYLREMAVGEAIVRPSSKGDDKLSLTWKWKKDSFVHLDIQEMDKPANPRLLGTRLLMNGEEYGDVDEIISRFVAPCNDLMGEALEYDKFRDCDTDEVTVMLREVKKKETKRIPYMLHTSKTPGFLKISYLPGANTVLCEKVEVTPEGFKMRGQIFTSVTNLINQFKKLSAHAVREGTGTSSTSNSTTTSTATSSSSSRMRPPSSSSSAPPSSSSSHHHHHGSSSHHSSSAGASSSSSARRRPEDGRHASSSSSSSHHPSSSSSSHQQQRHHHDPQRRQQPGAPPLPSSSSSSHSHHHQPPLPSAGYTHSSSQPPPPLPQQQQQQQHRPPPPPSSSFQPPLPSQPPLPTSTTGYPNGNGMYNGISSTGGGGGGGATEHGTQPPLPSSKSVLPAGQQPYDPFAE